MPKHTLYRQVVRVSATITFVVMIVVMVTFWSQAPRTLSPLRTDRGFVQQQLGTTYHLDDLGVTDINNDDLLDIYTTNHYSRQKILINNGDGTFTDQVLQLGLSTNREFPGVERSDQTPSIELPGLYIYRNGVDDLIIQAHDISDIGAVMGQTQLPKHIIVNMRNDCQASILKNENNINVDFVCKDDGWLVIKDKRNYFGASFKLSKNIPLDLVYIGTEKLHPNSHEFMISLGRDRHGMTWADYNGDDQTDIFITLGGDVGKMKPDRLRHNDELLIKDGLVFTDRAAESGIVKDVCPGRRVASVDFDGDGKLDIYVTCGRGTPPRQLYPNQLHWQRAPGQFVNIAAERGLDIPEEGAFVWLDADSDGDMDLFWTDNGAFWLYVNQSGQFTRQPIGQNFGRVKNLTIADYDSDRDIDVFAASEKGNVLLINNGGTYELTALQSTGLPAHSHAAQWVDYDNDGLTDLYVSPDGIYRQRSDHRFEATQLLERQYVKRGQIFSTWFDADNDGLRDLLIAVKELPPIWTRVWLRLSRQFQNKRIFRSEKWHLILYRNIGAAKDHWLQFQLVGAKGNRPAIGAMVEVISPDSIQRQQVGQAEGSIRSQGHYRLYFGLGPHQQEISAKIYWPDGHLQEMTNLTVDQLVVIQREGVKVSRSTDR